MTHVTLPSDQSKTVGEEGLPSLRIMLMRGILVSRRVLKVLARVSPNTIELNTDSPCHGASDPDESKSGDTAVEGNKTHGNLFHLKSIDGDSGKKLRRTLHETCQRCNA
jgi:hypothetical protein